ncbi:MAG: OB-fold domain-containing protein [Dethiobacter sp.]|jgi:3-hydroxy-3-methylglutaryl CoA synthase|nr:OB-fold domain-containing protein [Dethiobacter sp.]
MVGITSFGAYVPYNRLERKHIKAAFGKPVPPGEKAVANYDEDSITMGVAAGLECCKFVKPKSLDALYFATTTSPYKEKQCATVIAAALDTGPNLRTADFTDTLRAGSTAMLAAIDAAKNGLNVLVSASDMRLGAADGQAEASLGDGAAAFVLGNKNVVAEMLAYDSVSIDFHDQWRSDGDIFIRSWEERFCISQGYNRFMTEAAITVMEKTGLKPKDFFRIINYGVTPRYQMEQASRLGFEPDQIQDGLYLTVGNAGVANAPMMLVAALEEAKPGNKILFLTYGEGSDAIVFQVTDEILKLKPRPGIKNCLRLKKNSMNYEKYLRWRGLITTEPARRPRQERSSLPDYFRNFAKNYALYGCKCTDCNTAQFPPTRVCVQCQSIDRMESYRFYGRKGKVVTFTVDYLTDSPDPPGVVVVVDFEGGGRMFCNLADCDLDKIQVGIEVEMSFRKLFTVDGVQTYFWKAIPKMV